MNLTDFDKHSLYSIYSKAKGGGMLNLPELPNLAKSLYIDAGTGSLILQAVLGSLFGALVFIKIFWNRLKALFNRLILKKKGADEIEE